MEGQANGYVDDRQTQKCGVSVCVFVYFGACVLGLIVPQKCQKQPNYQHTQT